MAGGVDVIYPKENSALYERIRDLGVLLSETPPGTEPQARHFPRRNRLISGSALGIVVVEARPGSGSLITARCALDQGREVFAVPGSPLDPRARGGNHLIRQGATLTETVDDVLRVLEPMRAAPEKVYKSQHPFLTESAPPAGFSADSAHDRIVAALGPAPVAVDEIIRSCQFSPAIVAAVLLELELAGRLERHPGNRVSLTHLP
jgi:DNA processing protein